MFKVTARTHTHTLSLTQKVMEQFMWKMDLKSHITYTKHSIQIDTCGAIWREIFGHFPYTTQQNETKQNKTKKKIPARLFNRALFSNHHICHSISGTLIEENGIRSKYIDMNMMLRFLILIFVGNC